eukprot:TRINITY_DN10569_c1_g1_i6.p1 TRINITY_DN10569_c1_g1~~TRINITY_DN10569_c1_g1_i6.p1  ORF type:complete len:452 (+),score=-49.71 TRINITY_DN10569_c1_g1_i6:45-1358(+)
MKGMYSNKKTNHYQYTIISSTYKQRIHMCNTFTPHKVCLLQDFQVYYNTRFKVTRPIITLPNDFSSYLLEITMPSLQTNNQLKSTKYVHFYIYKREETLPTQFTQRQRLIPNKPRETNTTVSNQDDQLQELTSSIPRQQISTLEVRLRVQSLIKSNKNNAYIRLSNEYLNIQKLRIFVPCTRIYQTSSDCDSQQNIHTATDRLRYSLNFLIIQTLSAKFDLDPLNILLSTKLTTKPLPLPDRCDILVQLAIHSLSYFYIKRTNIRSTLHSNSQSVLQNTLTKPYHTLIQSKQQLSRYRLTPRKPRKQVFVGKKPQPRIINSFVQLKEQNVHKMCLEISHLGTLYNIYRVTIHIIIHITVQYNIEYRQYVQQRTEHVLYTYHVTCCPFVHKKSQPRIFEYHTYLIIQYIVCLITCFVITLIIIYNVLVNLLTYYIYNI